MNRTLVSALIMATLPIACTAPSSDTAETAAAAIPEVSDKLAGPVFTGPAGSASLAVSGYDAVSYFEGDGVPVTGTEDHRIKYNGVEYHFASAANAEKFQAEPGKYAPKYGGHCAWAMSRGKLAPGDPLRYKIVDGVLYLNFDERVQGIWLEDVPGFIEKS